MRVLPQLAVTVTGIGAALLFTAGVASAAGTPLTQDQAEDRLISNGITATSPGNCTDKNNPSCVSYEGILSGTVDGVINLKKASGVASLIVIGGTEVGHGEGEKYTHANGYKIDLLPIPALNDYIKGTFRYAGLRGDGFPLWKSASGDLYCDEGSHWDIIYF
ncbi:hypothetical protein ABZ876_04605 [Streptomyces sp. NPDC046931]|uniref:hypothetical protein n=1 Tax=Streptomyces sp. NPDC046931 TaxID=3154806 RepID=UPI0033DB8719